MYNTSSGGVRSTFPNASRSDDKSAIDFVTSTRRDRREKNSFQSSIISTTVRIAYSVSLTDAEKDVFVPFEFKNEKISFNNNGHHSSELFDLDTIKNIDPFLFLF